MTPERINEIFQGVQELREWWKTTAQNKSLVLQSVKNAGSLAFLGKSLFCTRATPRRGSFFATSAI